MSEVRVRGQLRPAMSSKKRSGPGGARRHSDQMRPVTSRAAAQLALAHLIERLIEEGVVADLADAAQRLGVTRARMTQIANMSLLSPRIQEALLLGTWRPRGARALRPATRTMEWGEAERVVPWRLRS